MDQQSEGHGVTPIDLSVILGEPQSLEVTFGEVMAGGAPPLL